MNAIRTIRNNWKKTVFFVGLSGFGARYLQKKYQERLIVTAYCVEAKKYGDVLLQNSSRPRKVTVFLNPAAKRGKGKDLYEKNVAPLFHLAGLEVTLVKTEYEGQAKKYMDVIDPTDAIIVVGGDGTVSEVVTGLLRRTDFEEQFAKIPLGVVPVGQSNSLAKALCPETDSNVAFLAEMAMSVIKGFTQPVDVIHIKGDEDRSVYAVAGLDWGAYTDAEMRKKSNWYFGPLKHRLAYVVSVLRYWPPINEAVMSCILPCSGCSRCYIPPSKPQWRWWHIFIPPRKEVTKDYSKVVNEECGELHTQSLSVAQLTARLHNGHQQSDNQEPKAIDINVIDSSMSKKDFIRDGWNRLTGRSLISNEQRFSVKQFTLAPVLPKDKEAWFLIDNERFELMNFNCQLLPNKLHFFFSRQFSVPVTDITRSAQL